MLLGALRRRARGGERSNGGGRAAIQAKLSTSAAVAVARFVTPFTPEMTTHVALASEGELVHAVDEHTLGWAVRAESIGDMPHRFLGLRALLKSSPGIAFGLSTTERHDALEVAIEAGSRAAAFGSAYRLALKGGDARQTELNAFEEARAAGQISIGYVPRRDAVRREIMSAEATLAWTMPGQRVTGADTIGMAADCGRTIEILKYLLDEAIGDFATVLADGSAMSLALCVPLGHVTATEYAKLLLDAQWQHGVLPSRLRLLIDQQYLRSAGADDHNVLRRLRDMGIAIDPQLSSLHDCDVAVTWSFNDLARQLRS
jgi:hypothetical protein